MRFMYNSNSLSLLNIMTTTRRSDSCKDTSAVRSLAYNRLQAAAVAFGESLPVPEIVAIGGQSDGKSSLLEAFLGFKFNLTNSEIGTRRPLIVQIRHSPGAIEPICRLQDENSVEFGLPLSVKEVSHLLKERTDRHLSQLNKSVSSIPIILRCEYAHSPNLTIYDMPGFILKAGAGQDESTPDDIRAMVLDICQPQHRLLLFVQQSSVEWASSLWLDIIKEKLDPSFSRTVIVSSKFDNRLKELNERWEVDKYLSASGYLPPTVSPFFIALPKDSDVYRTSSAEWRKAMQDLDKDILTQLHGRIKGGFDNMTFGSFIGISNLKRHLEDELNTRYRGAAPGILHLLQKRCDEAKREYETADKKLRDLTDLASLRKAALTHISNTTSSLQDVLKGCILVDVAAYGLTSGEEREKWSNISTWPGCEGSSEGYAPLKLAGRAAVERCLIEFQEVIASLEFPPIQQDQLVNLVLGSQSGHDLKIAASHLARCTLRESVLALLQGLCARLAAIIRHSFYIAEQRDAVTQQHTMEHMLLFQAKLRSVFNDFVSNTEQRSTELVKHHLNLVTSALGAAAAPGICDQQDVENGVRETGSHPPFSPTKMALPETPTPDASR